MYAKSYYNIGLSVISIIIFIAIFIIPDARYTDAVYVKGEEQDELMWGGVPITSDDNGTAVAVVDGEEYEISFATLCSNDGREQLAYIAYVYGVDDKILLPSDTFAREGYSLIGWKPGVDSDVMYHVDSEVIPEASCRFYAVWERDVLEEGAGIELLDAPEPELEPAPSREDPLPKQPPASSDERENTAKEYPYAYSKPSVKPQVKSRAKSQVEPHAELHEKSQERTESTELHVSQESESPSPVYAPESERSSAQKQPSSRLQVQTALDAPPAPDEQIIEDGPPIKSDAMTKRVSRTIVLPVELSLSTGKSAQQALNEKAVEAGIPVFGLPISAPEGSSVWAIVNLLLTAAAVSISGICFFRKRPQRVRPRAAYAAVAVSAVIFFVLTQDIWLPITYTDSWTPYFTIPVLVGLVLMRRKEDC